MIQTEVIYFKRVPGLSHAHFEHLHRAIVQSAFDHECSEGFIDVERTGDSLSAVLVLRRQALRTVFVEGKFLEQAIIYYQQVPFTIDAPSGMIDVFAGAQKASKVASVIGKILHFQYPIEDVSFLPKDVYGILTNASYCLEITQLCIVNFHPLQGVHGRFSPTITQTSQGLALLEEYGKDVTDALYEVKSPSRVEFTLRVSSAGGLAIRVEEKQFDLILGSLKKMLLPS